MQKLKKTKSKPKDKKNDEPEHIIVISHDIRDVIIDFA